MLSETKLKEQLEIQEQATKEHRLILFNDDVNTFDYVIDMLIKVCDHDAIQAEQCATLVHYTGKCAVKNGGYEELLGVLEILNQAGLTVEIN